MARGQHPARPADRAARCAPPRFEARRLAEAVNASDGGCAGDPASTRKGRAANPAYLCAMAGSPRKSDDGRRCVNRVWQQVFGSGPRRRAGGLRCALRAAESSRVAGLARGGIHGPPVPELSTTQSTPGAGPEHVLRLIVRPHLPAIEPLHSRRARRRPAQPPPGPRPPIPR